MDPILLSRWLTGITLAVHIIFAAIGVGVPVMIALAEWRGIRKKDPHYLLMARRWARGFVITVAVGVVTGTSIALQLNLLWPAFMKVAGQAIALPLFMETFAFFVEAIFLGIYLYTWDRFKSKVTHLLLLIPVAIGASASAFFITTVNAFMSTPRGFKLQNGIMTDIQPIVAMFSPATPTKVAHVLTSSYTASACVLIGIGAWKLLSGHKHVYFKKSLKLCTVCAFIFTLSTAVIGDFSGKFLAKYNPEKLAAAEWHFETGAKAPLVLGGKLDENNQIKYGIKIPYALSILAGDSPNTVVKGLNDFPENERPPLYIHYLFDTKVAIGCTILLISFLYMLLKKKRHTKWLLRLLLFISPLGLIAVELGWIFAEVGRQPWILYRIMRTSKGATTAMHVDIMLVMFCILYAVLMFTVVKVLMNLFKNRDVSEELKELGVEGGDIK